MHFGKLILNLNLHFRFSVFGIAECNSPVIIHIMVIFWAQFICWLNGFDLRVTEPAHLATQFKDFFFINICNYFKVKKSFLIEN